MGSLYRSQHELLPLFKKGSASHVNNVELGKKGRWRSNVWTYPGASSLGSDARRGLQDHPTVKPTVMLEDALLDLTNRGDFVLDPFLGSGSTLIAADKTGRVCRGVELDPLYVDVIVRRYEATSGEAAVLVETGETFEDLEQRRARERASGTVLETETRSAQRKPRRGVIGSAVEYSLTREASLVRSLHRPPGSPRSARSFRPSRLCLHRPLSQRRSMTSFGTIRPKLIAIMIVPAVKPSAIVALSGSIDREQGVSKAGNPRLRAMLLQLAWLWLRHQPHLLSLNGSWIELKQMDRLKKPTIVALAQRRGDAAYKSIIGCLCDRIFDVEVV